MLEAGRRHTENIPFIDNTRNVARACEGGLSMSICICFFHILFYVRDTVFRVRERVLSRRHRTKSGKVSSDLGLKSQRPLRSRKNTSGITSAYPNTML